MNSVKIIDLNGLEIAVTDLSLAILQADDFRHYRHLSPEYTGLDVIQQRYWEDIFQKLTALRERKK